MKPAGSRPALGVALTGRAGPPHPVPLVGGTKDAQQRATVLAAGLAGHDPGGLPGEGAQDRLGVGREEVTRPGTEHSHARGRVALAWFALLAAGLSMAFTGELDWTLAGVALYGEYVVEFWALGLAAFVLWACGLRSDGERIAARVAILAAVLAPLTVPLGSWAYWPAEAAIHGALVAQLAMWGRAAAAERRSETWPVGVMLAGMAVETLGLFWKMLSTWAIGEALPAECAGDPSVGMWLTCAGSAYQSMALPMAITLVLLPWFAGLYRPWAGRS